MPDLNEPSVGASYRDLRINIAAQRENRATALRATDMTNAMIQQTQISAAANEMSPQRTIPIDGIDASAFESAFRSIAQGTPIVLVLGGAGTGKTTFLRELQRRGGTRQVLLAPTGVAALNLGGQTIHSFFGIPPRIVNVDEVSPRGRRRELLRRVRRIVIDEVSMMRSDLVDVIDSSLRVVRDRPEAFGGVQMVLVGDFLQLPPVVPPAEAEVLLRLGFSSPYAFDARVLRGIEMARVPFTTVYRQTDRAFVQHLSRIRRGEQIDDAVEAINAACCRPHRTERTPIVLAPTNASVDDYNERGLAMLRTAGCSYMGESSGDFDMAKGRLPVPKRLFLKVGARVMAVRNDAALRWVNGSLGTVRRLESDRVWVQFDSGCEAEIERVSWERVRYVWNNATVRIETKVAGSYAQLPLIHAWASTMHKAQGLTLEDVRIDFDDGAFAPGRAYVPLSRARSLAGLSLARALRSSDVRVDPRVTAFIKAFERSGMV
jgi:ATP-dependent DNA helicase PIF1